MLGRQRQDDPWDSMARQPSLLGELQTSEKPCLQNNKVDGWRTDTQECALTFTCTCIHTHTCIYTHKEKMGAQHAASEAEMSEEAATQARPMLPASTKLEEARESQFIIVEQRGLASTLILASGLQDQETIHLLF